ncbi:uncharacterized protein KIAA1211 homolog [Arapaima gigas]
MELQAVSYSGVAGLCVDTSYVPQGVPALVCGCEQVHGPPRGPTEGVVIKHDTVYNTAPPTVFVLSGALLDRHDDDDDDVPEIRWISSPSLGVMTPSAPATWRLIVTMAADTQDAHLEVPENAEQRGAGKFQPFKRLFRKRRKKERAARFEEAGGLKASRSTGDVCNGVPCDDDGARQYLRELKALGSRAVSHDSVFVPEAADGAERMSQENVSDRVRSLQKQIAQSIKFGQKSSSLRKSEDGEGSSDDDDEAPRRPLQVLAQVEAEPADAKVGVQAAVPGGVQAEAQDGVRGGTVGTPVKSPRSRRAPPAAGTIESINLDAVPLSFSCLDSTAARHKLSVKPKNQRLSRKHRRFTQDEQEICPVEGLRDDGEPQTPAGTIGTWSRADREAPLWREDEHLGGSPEQSKKPKLQAETGLVDVDWSCEEAKDSRRQLECEEKRLKAEEETWKKQQRAEVRLHETEEIKRREEEEAKMRAEQDSRKGEEETRRRKGDDEVEKQSRDADVRQQETLMEVQRFREERQQTVEEEDREEDKRLRELEEQRLREQQDQLLREEKESQRKREEEEQRRAEERQRRGEAERREKERREQEQQEKERREREEQLREAEERELSHEVTQIEKTHRCPEEDAHPEEWKRKAEELRWKEMEERQRPFTFKVSSGEKQILFQRVNLSPVTPSSQQGGTAESKLSPTARSTEVRSTLPSSMFVPHTAILVTGAQLCGAAVNLDQIKDPACKSLLGLSEDKKATGLLLNKGPGKTSPERKSGKTKSLNESSGDRSGSAVLEEWATIRSKIFKRAENGSIEDKDTRHPSQPPSEDLGQRPVSSYHSHLRKTVSANAKFSITPARQKFPDLSKTSDVLSQGEKDGGRAKSSPPDAGSPPAVSPGAKPPSWAGKNVRVLDRTEGCVFAKDLPSFLVPSPPQVSLRTRSQSEALSPADSDSSADSKGQSGEDKASPFGIKLRRTNYSLRFRGEQPVEKRKKRYSAGDSFDGIPVPLTSVDPDSDASAPSDKSSPSSPLRSGCRAAAEPDTPLGRAAHPAVPGDGARPLPRPLPQKPLIAPKPGTPPPSPRSPEDSSAPGSAVTSYLEKQEAGKGQENSGLQPRSQQEEEGPRERKSFFPTISIPWREKGDRRAEILRREKPSLQSRHSLDGGRVQGKDGERAPEKEAGPLWITLALQKQKGFREQQQSREEHRHLREARLAEKQAREHGVSPDCRWGADPGGGASTQKVPEYEKVDSPLGAFERREHLRKANTLPGSVTVEIADTTSSALPAKDSAKRFPPPEPVQVSTEPAWLALAKRKAKAWSDCPQIIK